MKILTWKKQPPGVLAFVVPLAALLPVAGCASGGIRTSAADPAARSSVTQRVGLASPSEPAAPEAPRGSAGRARETTGGPGEADVGAWAPGALLPSPAARRASQQTRLEGLETGTMWTFENPPLSYWDSTYGFRPTSEWLEHVRLSSVRFGEICSASFVSPNGLVMTNHHCARECAEAVSDATHDHVQAGFYADSRQREILCPGLYLDQLVRISDVTDRIKGAARAGMADEAAVAAQDSAARAAEAECEADSGHTCQVVTLYHGGQYQLYEYRRYAPVKLVFLPELQAAYFGGDPDNFTYPRYDLDVAFVRAYEADSTTAAATPHYFRWNPEGAAEGELVFITGNPGTTSRLATVSELMYEQRFRHPFILTILEGQRTLLQSIASRGPQAARAVRDNLFSVENSLKAFRGQLGGLRDTTLIGRKMLWEREFRRRVEGDPRLAAEYGDAWERMEAIQRDKFRLAPPLNVNNPDFLGGPYESVAGTLVTYLHEMAKPETERSAEFRGEELAKREALLRQPQRPDPEVAESLLALRLEIAERFLPADDPFRSLAFRAGETPAEAARRLISGSRLMEVGYRQRLLEGGPGSLEGTGDALLGLATHMAGVYPELASRWEATTSAEQVQEERLADALFATFGTDVPPDATFTLRISDGVIRRYPYNGTFAPPYTTFYGLYARAAEFGNEMPWKLSAAFEAKRAEIDLSTPLNFVATNDITGGNSGSPVIDREARIVGVAFDGNIEQLPNEFLFRTRAARSVGVHSAGILEALRNAYGARELLSELLAGSGGAAPPGSAP
ncbi:MAG: S46 family peptidase [Gemmatimonadota bacterium]